MLLEAHQPWSVSCYRREVKRLFQLLSYWLRPPSGQARPSVNPARNERRSLPTEEVSLWVYVMCPPALTRQMGSAGGRVGCARARMRDESASVLLRVLFFTAFGVSAAEITSHAYSGLFPISIIYLSQICDQLSMNFLEPHLTFCSTERVALLPVS